MDGFGQYNKVFETMWMTGITFLSTYVLAMIGASLLRKRNAHQVEQEFDKRCEENGMAEQMKMWRRICIQQRVNEHEQMNKERKENGLESVDMSEGLKLDARELSEVSMSSTYTAGRLRLAVPVPAPKNDSSNNASSIESNSISRQVTQGQIIQQLSKEGSRGGDSGERLFKPQVKPQAKKQEPSKLMRQAINNSLQQHQQVAAQIATGMAGGDLDLDTQSNIFKSGMGKTVIGLNRRRLLRPINSLNRLMH